MTNPFHRKIKKLGAIVACTGHLSKDDQYTLGQDINVNVEADGGVTLQCGTDGGHLEYPVSRDEWEHVVETVEALWQRIQEHNQEPKKAERIREEELAIYQPTTPV